MTDSIASFLLPATLKGSLVCAGVLLAMLLLRRMAPSLRHLLLFLAISSFVMIPIAQLALPPLRVPSLLPPLSVRGVADNGSAAPAGSVISAPANASIGTVHATAASRTKLPVKGALLLLWATGALVLAGRSLIAHKMLRRLRRTALPLDGPCVDEVEKMAATAIANRRVRIRRTGSCDVPLTFGILRPVVLLPAAMLANERETFASVLAHELAHVERRDVLTGRIAYLICCLFWFTPFAWLALIRLRVEQEKACDLAALQSTPERSRYAEMLLRLRASIIQPPLLSRFSAQAGGEGALEERIRNVLHHDTRRIHVRKTVRTAMLLAVCAFVVPVSMTRCAPATSAQPASSTKDVGAAAASSFAPIWPIASKAGEARVGSITNAFGPSINAITKSDYFHEGIDIAWRFGAPVIASAEGVVAETGYTDDRGRYVILQHANGFTTFYSHLEAVRVKKDDTVRQGQTIGSLGSTGYSTGPHLHYGISTREGWVDPVEYLDRRVPGHTL